MTSRKLLMGLLSSTALMGAWGALDGANAAACGSNCFVKGNVFASVGSSTVDVFTPTGTLVGTLNDASGTTDTTGSAFELGREFLRDQLRRRNRIPVQQLRHPGQLQLHDLEQHSGIR